MPPGRSADSRTRAGRPSRRSGPEPSARRRVITLVDPIAQIFSRPHDVPFDIHIRLSGASAELVPILRFELVPEIEGFVAGREIDGQRNNEAKRSPAGRG